MVLFFDTETRRFSPGNLLPEVMCVSYAYRNGSSIESGLVSNGDGNFRQVIDWILGGEHDVIVAHNAAFDLGCFATTFPDLLPRIFRLLKAEKVSDTIIRDKLLAITTHGGLSYEKLPGEEKGKPLLYDLADMVRRYLGLDISEGKSGDSWRTRFSELDGMPSSEYPDEAARYATFDAIYLAEIYDLQQLRCLTEGPGPASVHGEFFQTAASFATMLATATGVKIDPLVREHLLVDLQHRRRTDQYPHMLEADVLFPGEAPRPWRNNPSKMTAGKAPSIKEGILREIVDDICRSHSLPTVRTEPSPKFPLGQISLAKDTLEELVIYSPVLSEYLERESLGKLYQEVKKVRHDVVHPKYNIIVSSNRMSSSGTSKNVKDPEYSSLNIQQQHNDARAMYVARPGRVLVSSDFDFIELVSAGQRCFDLLGYSVLRDRINAGYDPHAYLGSQLALRFEDDFRRATESIHNDPQAVYDAFLGLKETHPDIYGTFRTMAKPVGLGYPGGLMYETMTHLMKGYGIDCSIEKARAIREEVWIPTYPEFAEYFDWIKKFGPDPVNGGLYAYLSRSGWYRAGATYCAACNGNAMQTDPATGLKIAAVELSEAMYANATSPLYGCRVLGYIHDEVLSEIPDDANIQERVDEIERIMVSSMSRVLPDVKVSVGSAVMRRWNKKAKATYGADGRLTVWSE